MTTTRPDLTFPRQVATLVKKTYKAASSILEYGSGGSTVLAAEMPGKTIYSVESDRAWADNLRTYLETANTVKSMPQVYHADIGPTGIWGWPEGHAHIARFHKYPMAIWNSTGFKHPDVVLIDGRFRVACFLASVLSAQKPMTILFDDYGDRPNYHIIEEIVPMKKIVGRMAVFKTVPVDVTPALMLKLIEACHNPT